MSSRGIRRGDASTWRPNPACYRPFGWTAGRFTPSARSERRTRTPSPSTRGHIASTAARERRRASGASNLRTRGVTKSVSSAHFVGLSLAAAVAFNGASAQDTLSRVRGAAEPRPGYVIRRTTEPIRLDASLGEAIWGLADSVAVFRQREPAEGEAASERTVVQGDSRWRPTLRRRAGLRSGHAFRAKRPTAARRRSHRPTTTSPCSSTATAIGAVRFCSARIANGAMWDAQLVGLDNLNENWNGIWDVATRRDSRARGPPSSRFRCGRCASIRRAT